MDVSFGQGFYRLNCQDFVRSLRADGQAIEHCKQINTNMRYFLQGILCFCFEDKFNSSTILKNWDEAVYEIAY